LKKKTKWQRKPRSAKKAKKAKLKDKGNKSSGITQAQFDKLQQQIAQNKTAISQKSGGGKDGENSASGTGSSQGQGKVTFMYSSELNSLVDSEGNPVEIKKRQ
jgi:hypothetical protein